MESYFSGATKKNWNRLGINQKNFSTRLSKGANKRFSEKKIIPFECFENANNVDILHNILENFKDLNVDKIIYSLAVNLLNANGLISYIDGKTFSKNKFITQILAEYQSTIDLNLLLMDLPIDEVDFIGIVYQSLLNEGRKNIQGSYYTPKCISKLFLDELKPDDTFFDPCCGSGSFLLQAGSKIKNPEKIYGCDIDKTACFIAKINMIIKFKNIEFYPNIFNIDFLDNDIFKNKKFNLIATNPPWGAMTKEKYLKLFPEIKSKESFSYFIYAISQVIDKKGKCILVLPEAIMNIHAHKEIRKFILDKFFIKEIIILDKKFSSVFSNVIMLNLTKNKVPKIKITDKNKTFKINENIFRRNADYNFSIMSDEEFELIEKLYTIKHTNLNESEFALGIVTGNNKKHLISKPKKGSEIIYTGKNVSKYFLQPGDKYIVYNRDSFQQVAKDNFYRAAEKLVYKFISKKLIFAYDNKSSLVLNSANIVIPHVKTHSIKTVLAFLNSKLFQFIYEKQFSDLKILKHNLCKLPFPLLDDVVKNKLETFVNSYLKTKNQEFLVEIDNIVYECFNLDENQIRIVEQGICL